MTESDVAELLTHAAAYDRRTIGRADVLAWHRILGHIDQRDAIEAVVRHYAGTRDFLMPADVLALVKQIRKERLERLSTDEVYAVPAADPDDVPGYLQALRAGVTAIADGTERPRPVRQLTADAFHVVPKPDYGTRRRFDPVGLQDRAGRRAELVSGPVVVDPEAT